MCQHCAPRWRVMISVYRKRHEDLDHFFKMDRGLVACTDIDGLMQTLNITHNPLDWLLYTGLSKLSFKAVPLHSGNTLPLLLLVIQCIIRSRMRTWRFWWKPLITNSSNDKCMVTWNSLPYYLDYNKGSKNIAASVVNGTAELSLFIIQERTGLPENLWIQESRMWKINHYWNQENFVAIHAFKAWSDEKFCKGHKPKRSCLYLLMRNVPQTKWGKIERRYFHWSTNTRPYQGRILRQAPSRRRKGGLGQF